MPWENLSFQVLRKGPRENWKQALETSVHKLIYPYLPASDYGGLS